MSEARTTGSPSEPCAKFAFCHLTRGRAMVPSSCNQLKAGSANHGSACARRKTAYRDFNCSIRLGEQFDRAQEELGSIYKGGKQMTKVHRSDLTGCDAISERICRKLAFTYSQLQVRWDLS